MNQSRAPEQAPPAQAPEAPQVAPAPASAQDTAGNAAVAEGLGLGGLFPDLGGLFGASLEEQVREEQAEFLRTPWPACPDFDTGTGGNFDASLVANQLFITLKVAYDFVAGDPASAPVGVTAAELQWTPEEQAVFRADYSGTVTGSWSFQHAIRSTRPLWTTTVQVLVLVVEDDADPHFRIRVEKYPPDAGDNSASVCDRGYHHGGGVCDPNAPGDTSGSAILDSRDVDPTRVRNGNQPVIGVWFAQGRSDLDGDAQTAIDGPARSLNANPGWTVELTGHASTEGDATDNMQLARDRTDAVAGELEGRGVARGRMLVENEGEQDANAVDFDRRVDVHVLDVENQITAAHETGHMFGLNDEYLGAGEAPGTAFDADYRQLIADNAEIPPGGLPTKGPADSIMSNGMEVENWHYAPFVAAVKQITGSDDWTV